MPYTPHTDAEIQEMLQTAGVQSIDELFSVIPEKFRCKDLHVPPGLSEMEVEERARLTAQLNESAGPCFLGGGAYDHFIPAAVDALMSRAEFFTAYTPYQPEASQGTLQALYEYQTAMCELTGMEASNASLYDGATALAEAALMCLRLGKKKKHLVADSSINPLYLKVLKTYLQFLDVDFQVCKSGEKPEDLLREDTAGVMVQNPDFLGNVRDYSALTEKARDNKTISVASVNPISLGLVKTPGEMGFDIAIGEGQSMGNALNGGGPWFGFITCTMKHIRQLPGRIAGKTLDAKGREGYVLTLQAREQHIKRHRATSNICTNQSLCALSGLVWLSLLGKQGFTDLATLCHRKAEYLKYKLALIEGVKIINEHPTFHEFTIRLPESRGITATQLVKALQPTLAGIPLSLWYEDRPYDLLIAVTEKRSKKEMDKLAWSFNKALHELGPEAHTETPSSRVAEEFEEELAGGKTSITKIGGTLK